MAGGLGAGVTGVASKEVYIDAERKGGEHDSKCVESGYGNNNNIANVNASLKINICTSIQTDRELY